MTGHPLTSRTAKTRLRKAIMAWGNPEASGGMRLWRAIERAIIEVDQAARRDVIVAVRGLK